MNRLRYVLKKSCGFTLLELLLVMGFIAVLAGLGAWAAHHMVRGWLLKRAGHQLLEDIKTLQGRAEMSGSLTMSGGPLVMQRAFLVFDAAAGNYTAYLWQDDDNDNVPDTDEARLLWQRTLPQGIVFGWTPEIDHRACSNGNGAPGSAISFSSPAYPPCGDQPCIKFDRHGFSVLGPGAIYLSDGEQSMAMTMTRPGNISLCEWNGERWH